MLRNMWLLNAKKIAIASTCASTLMATGSTALAAAIPTPLPGETQLVVYNASNSDTYCMVSIGGTQDGCPTSTYGLNVRDLTINGPMQALIPFGSGGNPGWFRLPRGHRIQIFNIGINPYTGQRSACFQSMNMGFGQVGNNCPDSLSGGTPSPNTKVGPGFNQNISPPAPLPNGSNAFEPTLNLPGTVAGAFNGSGTAENIDISCVKGANARINVSLIPPVGGPYWQTNLGPQGGGVKTYTTTTSFGNSWVDFANQCDDNCVDPKTGIARPGVYPYGCSQCNMLPDPAIQCGQASVVQFCGAAKNGLPIQNNTTGTGCLYTRKPKVVNGNPSLARFGGTVQVNFLGPLSPPLVPPAATCQ
jgi:hypothetical protein